LDKKANIQYNTYVLQKNISISIEILEAIFFSFFFSDILHFFLLGKLSIFIFVLFDWIRLNSYFFHFLGLKVECKSAFRGEACATYIEIEIIKSFCLKGQFQGSGVFNNYLDQIRSPTPLRFVDDLHTTYLFLST
jgi:hypothetical protein